MRVLLVEPNYKNKYPPIGLMKISSYHKSKGDDVHFFKGCLSRIDFESLGIERIYITSLFTFYYKETIKTIKHYQELISGSSIYLGGILASLMPEVIKYDLESSINIIAGQLTNSSLLGFKDNINIDVLPLDYDILDQTEYQYPAGDNYFSYTTRGCTNTCKFCAVPLLEPDFCLTNNISEQIAHTKEKYGEKQNLLLLDNNILSLDEDRLHQVVNDICDCGFDKVTKFHPEIPLKTYLRKLSNHTHNSRVFDKLLKEAIGYLHEKLSIKMNKNYESLYKNIIQTIDNAENPYQIILDNHRILDEILSKYHQSHGRKRSVDFNQGIDARQLTESKMNILSKIPIEPFRLAYDNLKYKKIYEKAIRLAAKHGVKNFSNYILYNFNDHPNELWQRLIHNVNLAQELNIRIFSFPMKYAPIDLMSRNYIGEHWNKQYLRNIHAIINVTKGIVADGKDFFLKAFGQTIDEFHEILTMPKDFVIYRQIYENNGMALRWKSLYQTLSNHDKLELLDCLSWGHKPMSSQVFEILKFYKTNQENSLCRTSIDTNKSK